MQMRKPYGFILTFTGKQFFPLTPWHEDVCIEDVAHSLACQCRFTGHTREFYSTAEHSVKVSWVVRKLGGTLRQQLHGLVHDGGEAYLADIARPVKHDPSMHFYREMEAQAGSIVAESFGLDADEPAIVKQADNIMLGIEARDLMRPHVAWDKFTELIPNGLSLDVRHPWDWREAEEAFLDRYYALKGRTCLAA